MEKVIKLTSDALINNTSFYFKTIEDCKKFKYVFYDHWCNIPWKVELVDISSLSEYHLNHLNEDPKIKAEQYLNWGFNFVRFNGLEECTKEQDEFLNSFIEKITQ